LKQVFFIIVVAFVVQVFLMSGLCFAEWTPLLTSASFTGIEADVSTAVGGIISIALIILGAALLMRAFGK
jgi:hypothetical protein